MASPTWWELEHEWTLLEFTSILTGMCLPQGTGEHFLGDRRGTGGGQGQLWCRAGATRGRGGLCGDTRGDLVADVPLPPCCPSRDPTVAVPPPTLPPGDSEGTSLPQGPPEPVPNPQQGLMPWGRGSAGIPPSRDFPQCQFWRGTRVPKRHPFVTQGDPAGGCGGVGCWGLVLLAAQTGPASSRPPPGAAGNH